MPVPHPRSSTKEGEQLGYIKGSYQKLTDRIYKYLVEKNVNIKLSTNILEINKENEKYVIKYEKDNKEKEENFDIIISTLNYEKFQELFKKYIQNEEKEKMEKVQYTSARTMILITDKSFSPFYWLNIGDDDIPFGGIIEHTNFIDKSNYQNNNIIYISNYMTKENKLYNLSKMKNYK